MTSDQLSLELTWHIRSAHGVLNIVYLSDVLILHALSRCKCTPVYSCMADAVEKVSCNNQMNVCYASQRNVFKVIR